MNPYPACGIVHPGYLGFHTDRPGITSGDSLPRSGNTPVAWATSELKNYSGVLAANFNFTDQGKYGVICLVKNEDKKHVFKFWYEHGM